MNRRMNVEGGSGGLLGKYTKIDGQGYLKGFFQSTGRKSDTHKLQGGRSSAKQKGIMCTSRHSAWTRRRIKQARILVCRCTDPALLLWEAAFGRCHSISHVSGWLHPPASFLPPACLPACVTSALTSHMTSQRTSKGDPCSRANIR